MSNPSKDLPYNDLPFLSSEAKLDIDTSLLIKARAELAELKGYSAIMPNPLLLLSNSLLRESIASSEIENIHTTLADVLQAQLFSEDEQTSNNKEVLRYRSALLEGVEHFGKLSTSTRLIESIQHTLLPDTPKGYRRKQNHVVNGSTGEILYTPPAQTEIPRLMQNWEEFVNTRSDVDPLIKSAIAHYQFEAIHPFDDGNGRTGRIIMVLQLIQDGILSHPTLFISGYLIQHRSEYYERLRGITYEEQWNSFIEFMLEGFYEQAKETKETLFGIMELYKQMKDEVRIKHKKMYSADLIDALFSFPIINPVKLADMLNVHYVTASKYLDQLAKAGMLDEMRHGRYHLYINKRLLKVLKASYLK